MDSLIRIVMVTIAELADCSMAAGMRKMLFKLSVMLSDRKYQSRGKVQLLLLVFVQVLKQKLVLKTKKVHL